MGIVIDDSFDDRKVVVSENKSGNTTVNGKSSKQIMYNYRRKYGDEAADKLLKEAESLPDLPDPDQSIVDSNK